MTEKKNPENKTGTEQTKNKERSNPENAFRGLASADELRGRKSGTGQAGKEPAGRRRFAAMTGILVLVLFLAGGLYLLSRKTPQAPSAGPEAETTAAAGESVKLISRTREDVAEVTVETGGESYTVVNGPEGGAFSLKGQPWFDPDPEKAAAVIGCAANLTANRVVTDCAEDLKAFGLENPKARIVMSYRDGTETAWLIGDKAPTSTASYFMQEGTRTVYLLYASAAESLSRERLAMHTLALPGTIDSNRIREMKIEGEGRETIEIGYSEEETDKNYSVSALRIRQPFYYTASVERASELFNGIATLSLESYAGEIGELENTGLENGGARFCVTVRQSGGAGGEDETFVYRIGRFTPDGKYVYLRVDETDKVYLTKASSVTFLDNATPAYLADSYSNLIYINAVNGIEITRGNDCWKLEIEHGKEENAPDAFRFNGRDVKDEKAFKKLYQQIIGTTHSKISQDYDLDGETLLAVRYLLDVEPGEVLVEYLAYDGDYCAVRRDGLTLFLIKKDQVDALEAALRQFDEELN